MPADGPRVCCSRQRTGGRGHAKPTAPNDPRQSVLISLQRSFARSGEVWTDAGGL
jgi:hypothetical protein